MDTSMVTCVKRCVIWAAMVAFLGGLEAGADMRDEPFSLRFPAALSRFSPYADVAACGGASAGSQWGTSTNPASAAWRDDSTTSSLDLSVQYTGLCFSEGTKLHVASQSLAWDAGALGAFQPALAQVRSNKRTTRQGLDFRYEMDYAQLQWARKVAEDWALGAGLNFATSLTRFDFGSLRASESNGESYGVRVGALHKPKEQWLIGLVFDYGCSYGRTTMYDLFGQGFGDLRIKDTTHQFLLRPGISYEYKEDSAIYLDYQLGYFCNDEGRLETHRFLAGVDHGITSWLFVRAGVAKGVHTDASWTAGTALYPNDWLTIDLAYQDNMYPELSPEFGSSRAVVLSVGLSF